MKINKKRTSNTFIIKVYREEYSTWQGTFTWADERKTQSFKSALELIRLMDEAIMDGKELEGGSHDN